MRKIIDQNGRLFGLISIIDVFVLILVLLLAAAFVVKSNTLSPAAQGGVAGVTVTYQILVENLENDLVENIYVGDNLFDHDQVTGGTIGTITAVEVSPAYRSASLPDGTVVDAHAEGYSDVLITAEGVCDIVEGSYRFNNIYILGVNAYRNLYTPFIGFPATVLSIG